MAGLWRSAGWGRVVSERKLVLRLTGNSRGSVELDGVQLNGYTQMVSIRAEVGEPIEVVLELAPIDIDVDCEAGALLVKLAEENEAS